MSEKKVNTVQSQKDTAQSKGKLFLVNVRKSFWVGIAILAILLILSIVVLSVIIVEYARTDDRALSIKSNMDAKLEVFSIYYVNDSGDITVKGANGNKVVAPGTDVEYTIRVKNVDNIAIDYELIPQVELLSEYNIPILVRILDPDDNYILGDAKTWASIEQLGSVVHRDTLKRGEAVEYTFQWKWPYESGNDEYDTFLGGANVNAGLSISFSVHAAANTDINANGGFIESGMAKTVALLIVAIMLLVALILFVVAIIKRKKNEPTPPPPPAPEPIPEPEPESEPVAAPEPQPKKQGFYGKMAYINIDVLNDNFESGDVISLSTLKEKGLLSENTKQMKILARNGYMLEKAFVVETQGISSEARKIIVKAGGVVVITKG